MWVRGDSGAWFSQSKLRHFRSWDCGSMGQCFSGMFKALGFGPSAAEAGHRHVRRECCEERGAPVLWS